MMELFHPFFFLFFFHSTEFLGSLNDGDFWKFLIFLFQKSSNSNADKLTVGRGKEKISTVN